MKSAITAGTAAAPVGRPNTTRGAVWGMVGQACGAAALLHVMFVVLFASMRLPLLVWANVGSVVLFIASRELLRRRRNLLAIWLIFAEVVLHATIASLLLGWDSGFHYYLLALVGPAVVTMSGRTASKMARLLAFGAGYEALDAWTRLTVAVYALDPYLLHSLRCLNLAGTLAIMAFVALAYYRQVTAAESALRALAGTDPLTGLHNRRRLIEIVRAERAGSRPPPGLHAAAPANQAAEPNALWVIICDIDHFKHVNDRHGHEMGDLVLQRVAMALQDAVRATDSVARWGGEEFVVLLPHADAATAQGIGERIRQAVAALSIEAPAPGAGCMSPPAQQRSEPPRLTLALTITLGVARIDPLESMDVAIARADAALYRGKTTGRNRVVMAGADSHVDSHAA